MPTGSPAVAAGARPAVMTRNLINPARRPTLRRLTAPRHAQLGRGARCYGAARRGDPSQRCAVADVRFGSKADIASRPRHVCYSTQSGHMSAVYTSVAAIGACERPALPQRSASALLVETIDRVARTPDASF